MKIEEKNWKNIKRLFAKAAKTTGHFSFATTGRDGIPHVTPIGSLFLTDFSKGYYFEEYASQMVKNFRENQRVCVMAVNGSSLSFLKVLIKGRSKEPISVRLTGRVGEKREATKAELERFLRLVRVFRWTRGYKLLWKDLKHVRDISFDSFQLVRVGAISSEQVI